MTDHRKAHAPQLPLPNPGDWCTIQYAAAQLGRSERTVRRWIITGKLRGYLPRGVDGEDPQTLVWVPELEHLAEALRVVSGAA